MTKKEGPVYHSKIMKQLSYPDGSTIRDQLNPKTAEALETHFANQAMKLDQFATFKPSMLYLLLSVIELQHLGIDVPGVDDHFATKPITENMLRLYLGSAGPAQ